MAVTRTFSIIKPDATRRNLTGAVTKMLEDAGLRVVASKRIQMDELSGANPQEQQLPYSPHSPEHLSISQPRMPHS